MEIRTRCILRAKRIIQIISRIHRSQVKKKKRANKGAWSKSGCLRSRMRRKRLSSAKKTGSEDDFMVQQALHYLKGEPVQTSKSLLERASATARSGQSAPRSEPFTSE